MVTATLTSAVGVYARPVDAPVHIPMHQLQGAQRLWADRLLSVVQGKPISGVEWGMKFSAAGLTGNRFTIGIARAQWPAFDWPRLVQLLAMPGGLWQQVQQDMQQAEAALFAFEPAAQGADSYRVYLERQPSAHDLREQGLVPLGRGYKWHPDTGREAAITDYRMRHLPSAQALAAHLQPYLAALSQQTFRQVADRLIAQAVALGDPRHFMLLEVAEAGSQRASFALTLRGVELPLQRCIPQLLRLAASVDVAERAVLDLLVAHEPRSLYSFAAGMGRDGHEFFTAYYD